MANSLDRMITAMVEKLEAGIESVAQKLAESFGASSSFWSSMIYGLISVGFAIIKSLTSRARAEVKSLGDEAKASVESVEKTRGLIAGQQSIAIQKLSEEWARALRPTNQILGDLLASNKRIEQLLGGSPAGSTRYSTGDGYAIEVLSSSPH